MNILGIESSAKTASVALLSEGRIAGEFTVSSGFTHSQSLLPMLDTLLQSTGFSLGGIDLFAVAAGPGSFTGLRIGISLTKSLAMAKNKPCIAVSSLEALAYNCAAFNGVICAAMDARRGQVYMALFQSKKGRISRLCGGEAILAEDLQKRLKKHRRNIMFVGDGAELCYSESAGKRGLIAPENSRFQKASSVCLLAAAMLENGGETVSAAELAPFYLRLPQAERERMERETARNLSK
ncbi:MAG: tRNA (adenosine(37)-N6)-threonylcarbamoyltransferase complex dimerization subunit type 1 TsaB [Oscillospiraceae bacterium]|nr:tRNA (adenosine(37)-N6)-threonylcarbamoyltransferase complex dimerization subunit type 1 TsaB [Oscillospiraceae bacterium]